MPLAGYINKKMEKTTKLIFLASGLGITGWLLVFLMVIDVIATSYSLCFFAYGIFMVGLTVGLVAAYSQAQMYKRERRWKKQQFHGEDGGESEA